MPIRWSALKVSEAMDMAEEFTNQAKEPLDQALVVARAARKIDNLPEYMDQRLTRLIYTIEGIDRVLEGIKAIRENIPAGAVAAGQRRAKRGEQVSLI